MKAKLTILLLIFSSSVLAKKPKSKPRYLFGQGIFAEYNSTSFTTDLIFLGYCRTDTVGRRFEAALGIPKNMKYYPSTYNVKFNSGVDFSYNFRTFKVGKRSTIGLRTKSVLVYYKYEKLRGAYVINDSVQDYNYAKVTRFKFGIMPSLVLTKNLNDQFYLDFIIGYQYVLDHIEHSNEHIFTQRRTNTYHKNNQYPNYNGWTHANGLYLGLKLIYNLSKADKLCK